MLAEARRAADADFRLISGERLDGVEDGVADTLVCYLVLQHLPRRALVLRYLAEFARVLAPGGAAFVQLPVLFPGARGRAWRAARSAALPLARRASSLERRPAYRGFRLTDRELARGLRTARLRVAARDEKPDSPYRFARDVFLRLEQA
jgi:SAM-dependent methyltransferase